MTLQAHMTSEHLLYAAGPSFYSVMYPECPYCCCCCCCCYYYYYYYYYSSRGCYLCAHNVYIGTAFNSLQRHLFKNWTSKMTFNSVVSKTTVRLDVPSSPWHKWLCLKQHTATLVAQPYWCNIEPIFNQYGILRTYWPRYNDCILTSCQYRKVVYSR